MRIELTPIELDRFFTQVWQLTNAGDVPVTVDAWGGRLFEVRSGEDSVAHWQTTCGNFEPDRPTLAPGESARVSELPAIGYAPLGAGDFRFTVALELADGTRGEIQADFELTAMEEQELAAAHTVALDGSFASCAWLPRYAGCVIQATPGPERPELVRHLGARGREVLGAAAQTLASVGDSYALLSLFESSSPEERPYFAAGLLELGGGWRLPAVRAREEAALQIVATSLREPGPAGTALLRIHPWQHTPAVLRDAWLARLAHEEDAIALAHVAHNLAREARVGALDDEHRAVTVRRVSQARERLDALRADELGAFMDELEQSLAQPGSSQALPLIDVLDRLRVVRARSTPGCGRAPALVRVVLDRCPDDGWMQPRNMTTAIRWDAPCAASGGAEADAP